MHSGPFPFAALLVSATVVVAAPGTAVAQSTPPADGAVPAVGAPSGFSASVTISDGQIFVGRPGGLDIFPMPAGRQGGVHVFGRSEGEWTQIASLAPEEAQSETAFGAGVDVAGDLLVVGAPTDGTGAVHVYRRDGDGWTFDARLTWEGAGAGARFGQAVATNGEDVIAGAPGAQSGNGAAVLYGRDGGGWTQAAVWTGADEPAGAGFGTSVDMEDGLAAVGAPGEMIALVPGVGTPTLLPGSVHVYGRGSDGWSMDARLEGPAGGPAALGWSVAVSGGELFAGAPLATGTGSVHHYTSGGTADLSW